jgi:hypothetical protein
VYAEAKALESAGVLVRHGREYAEGTSPFQDQVHARALVYDLFVAYVALLRTWAGRSRATVARWKDTSPAGKVAPSRRRFVPLADEARSARTLDPIRDARRRVG